ncbi:MAG: UDP-N-acetylmuramoyl-tripeptide--D-alanyl-D-alanine ligase [Bifidobacteriaceae bacterium]|jgi:UDP-N-acetylmuramoyl-tripeptide--D-alanyl-D-alanine ligase|nr:UDP-N-acetylmuramoyl-tripeptide--D-alanyl-D-alanine ligase [Bifidobacteriaceae bacterium]
MYKIDSRQILPGDIFVAINGENSNGNDYIEDAIKLGGTKIIFDDPTKLAYVMSTGVAYDMTDNSVDRLGELAKIHIQKQKDLNPDLKVIGITGSVGKTTIKDTLAKISREYFGDENVVAAKNSFNNDIGLPLTVLESTESTKVLILEMGSDHMGDIKKLTDIAGLDAAVISEVAGSHLEKFGSIENIAKEKASIINGLYEDGLVVFNGNNKLLLDAIAVHNNSNKHSINTAIKFKNTTAKHQDFNMTLAVKVAELALNIPNDFSVDFLNSIDLNGLTPHRLEFKKYNSNATLIDDSYNANEISTLAALDVLMNQNSENYYFVFGDILEAGSESKKIHESIIDYALKIGATRVFTVGDILNDVYISFADSKDVTHFENNEALQNELKKVLDTTEKTLILFKASNGIKLYEVIDGLK